MITVQDSLRLPELQHVVIRSGKGGLARKIRWVHIIDHDDIGHFLEGQEFLLSCGQVWPKDKESEEKFLYSLLRHQISGILLATGRYLTSCPPALLEFGEKYSIPILEIPFNVPFVKITYAIHQEIMERQYHKKVLASQVSSELLALMQTAQNNKDVCKILADYLKCTVVFTDRKEKVRENAVPQGEKRINRTQEINSLVIQFKNEYAHTYKLTSVIEREIHAIHLNTYSSYVLTVPLTIDESPYGTLWLLNDDKPLTERHATALKHAAQIVIDLYIDEQEKSVKQWQLQSEVLELLLEKQQTANLVIEKRIQEIGLVSKGKWMAGRILTGNVDLPPRTLLELGSFRSVCNNWLEEELDIDGFCELYNEKLVLLLTTSLENQHVKERLKDLSQRLLKLNVQIAPVFIIGSAQQELLSFVSSFKYANSLAPIVQFKSPSGGIYFSEEFQREILLYGKMSPAEAHYLLNKLLPDKMLFEEGEILYETLKCLALNHYNRENVAKILHIHRNTLRYRIKKIEELLQDSLSSPTCQFWVQTALNIQSLSYQYKP